MSENIFEPNPAGNNDESSVFDFSSLNPETTEPITHDVPNHKAGDNSRKRKWWESKPRAEKKPKRDRAMPTTPRGGLKPALTQMYSGIGMAVIPFDPHCGRIILENAEKCAETLDELAKTNPAVRRALLSLVTTSAWGAVIMAHAPILMAIAMHHVPALRERQEKMVGEFAEMMANMPLGKEGENE